MNGSFRQSMSWLHTWSGLVIGWLLFMMFLTGTLAVFNDEITAWMKPELRGPAVDAEVALQRAQARLEAVAGGAERWTITLPSGRYPGTRIAWQLTPGDPATTAQQREILDSPSGAVVESRETRGGDLFHRLHYRFEFSQPVQRAWWISGAATMFMLVAMVTGVIMHRRIFRDLFTFRPWASRQRSWLDAHLLLAVLLLPFHLAIAYTGLVPIMTTVMPWVAIGNYGEGSTPLEQIENVAAARAAYARDRGRSEVSRRAASGEPAPLVSLAALAERAEAAFGAPLGSVVVHNPGDRSAIVEIAQRPSGSLTNRPPRLYFDGTSGEPLPTTDTAGAVAQVSAAMYGLHMARFAEPLLRWVYFVAGLASTAMIGAGLIVWVAKRRRRYAGDVPFGQQLVERFNIASLAGLPIATASYFWANRLLPLDVADRAAVEVRTFFLVWLLTLAYASVRPPRRGWIEQLTGAALLFAGLPVLNALTTDRDLVAALGAGDWLMAGFDLTALATGALFAWAAWLVAHKQSAEASAAAPERAARLAEHTAATPAEIAE